MKHDIATAMIRMLEYGKGMNKPHNPRRKGGAGRQFNFEDLDFAELYLKLEAREKKLKASKEALEKLMKKEDKKPDANANMARIAFWLIASFPITGPLYYTWLTKTLGMH